MLDLEYIDYNYIYVFRKRLKLSQPQFADLFGVSVHTISRWESGNGNINYAFKLVLYLFEKEPKLLEEIKK